MDNSNAQELILWVIGRMDRLVRLGMIEGGSCKLSETGAAQYRELNELLAPPPSKVREVLIECFDQPEEGIDDIVRLVIATDDELSAAI